MKKNLWLVIILLLLFCISYSQERQQFPLLVSVSNNATQMPFTGYLGVFNVPMHPGISAGTQISLKDWEKWSIYETLRLGGYYHKYSQLALELYSELIFQYRIRDFAIEPQVHAGYMMAFTDLQIFELSGEVYEEKAFRGRSQIMTGMGLGFSYTLNKNSGIPVKLNLAYLVNLQMPFVKHYAPVIIISTLQLGATLFIPWNSK